MQDFSPSPIQTFHFRRRVHVVHVPQEPPREREALARGRRASRGSLRSLRGTYLPTWAVGVPTQSCCPTKTDRAPATEIADRPGRSVGALATIHTSNDSFSAPQAPIFGGKPMKSAIFRSKMACGALRTSPHQGHASSRPRCWRNGALGLRDHFGLLCNR